MTMTMILALIVLLIMIVLIMTEALPFGAPPLVACVCIVLFGLGDIPYAFAGFTDKTVWMLAFFMVILAAAQQTTMMEKIQAAMTKLVEKGGFKSYIAMLVIVTGGASVIGMGPTGYYVLILGLLAALPYNEKLPGSKLVMPLGFAANHPLFPVNVALQFGLIIPLLTSANVSTEGVDTFKVGIVFFVLVLAYIAWAIIGFRFLPNHPIAELATGESDKGKPVKLSSGKEKITVVCFLVAVVSMMLMGVIKDYAYIIPGVCAMILLLTKVLDFKQFRENMFAPVICMTAGVIPVANVLTDSGLANFIGDHVANIIGAGMPPFLIVLIFSLLTAAVATITGANIGSVYIFAPLAITTCLSLGYSPVAVTVAIAMSAWCGQFLPIDGLPSMIFGMGKYTMGEFLIYSIPMYLIRVVTLSVAACIVFPM